MRRTNATRRDASWKRGRKRSIRSRRVDNLEGPAAALESVEPIDIGEVSRERIESLESELRHSKENLQATVEELETSNEEPNSGFGGPSSTETVFWRCFRTSYETH